jgi:two-component system OmpR family response regulator
MKVLIVDDEDDIRRVVRLSLARVGGMEVLEAANGPDGLRAAESGQPDAILLDMMMPTMDGPATLEALRANPATKDIPIVFLTAKAQPAEVQRLHEIGALGVLTKPFDPMTLPALLRAILSGGA